MTDDRQVEDREDDDLGAHQDREHLRAQLDRPVAEEGRDGPADRGQRDPAHLDAGLVQDELGEVAEAAGEADGHRVVGQHRDQRDRHRRRLAEAAGDVGVERSGVDHATAHRAVADREAEQHDRGEDEGTGQARGVGQPQRQRARCRPSPPAVRRQPRPGRRCAGSTASAAGSSSGAVPSGACVTRALCQPGRTAPSVGGVYTLRRGAGLQGATDVRTRGGAGGRPSRRGRP